MSECCGAGDGRSVPSRARRVREVLAWAFPSVGLLLVPKCPACLAAYVALWTGAGLSLAAATYLRWAWLLLCTAALVVLVVKRAERISGNWGYFNKESEPCNIK